MAFYLTDDTTNMTGFFSVGVNFFGELIMISIVYDKTVTWPVVATYVLHATTCLYPQTSGVGWGIYGGAHCLTP